MPRIALAGNPLRAQHSGIDFVRRQHQRRHVIASFQHIAETGLATDRHALRHQVGDVAIDRAGGAFQLPRDGLAGERRSGPAQNLDDLKQAVGAAHRNIVLIASCMKAADSMLSAWLAYKRGMPDATKR